MRKTAPALLLVAFAASAWGQHGGAMGGVGRPAGGGFSGRSFSVPASRPAGGGPAYRGNFGVPQRRMNTALPQQHSYQYRSPIGSAPFGGAYPGGVPPAGGYPGSGPGHRHENRGGGYRPYYYSSGVYAVPGWLNSGFYGSGYGYGYPTDSGYSGDPQGAGPAPQPEVSEAAGDPGYQQGYSGPPSRPEYQPPAAPPAAATPAAELKDQPEVTLLFKDGRPSQQVQNYAVTRTTLYVFDGVKRREIPLDELDVPQTQRANREAGIDFAVPAIAD